MSVFRGFFANPDYSKPEEFLHCGSDKQTEITDDIRAIANNFNDRRDITTLAEIQQWLRRNMKEGEGPKFCRTSHEILTSRMETGCADRGLAFIALSRARNIPSVFVQTAHRSWVQDLQKRKEQARPVVGHILVEVYINREWYLIDPTTGYLMLGYDGTNPSISGRLYVFSKSLEVWDTGIRNIEENNETMINLFSGFEDANFDQ